MVCLHPFCCAGTTTGPLCYTFDCGRSTLGLLFCFSLYFIVYPLYQPGQLLYVALVLQVWENHRPVQVNIQSELPCRNIGVSLQDGVKITVCSTSRFGGLMLHPLGQKHLVCRALSQLALLHTLVAILVEGEGPQTIFKLENNGGQ